MLGKIVRKLFGDPILMDGKLTSPEVYATLIQLANEGEVIPDPETETYWLSEKSKKVIAGSLRKQLVKYVLSEHEGLTFSEIVKHLYSLG